MHDYRYSLDRSSRKYICPHCQRKTFVLYLDSNGQPLSPDVGKCDRQDKCNWHYPPAAFLRDNGFRQHPNHYRHYQPQSPFISKSRNSIREGELYIAPSYIKRDMMLKTVSRSHTDSLTLFLQSIFSPYLPVETIEEVLTDMAVGTSPLFGGSPIFWQIDKYGRVRTGKIMGYDKCTGKRIKQPKPLMQWVHRRLPEPAGGFRLQQCYFGSHLVRDDDRRIIWLFESEKAAIAVNLALRCLGGSEMFVALATGGCAGFNPTADKQRDPYDAIQVLKGKRVALFPDNGKYGEWRDKGERLRNFCQEVFIATVMEPDEHPLPTGLTIETGDGFDDLIFRGMAKGQEFLANLMLTSYKAL